MVLQSNKRRLRVINAEWLRGEGDRVTMEATGTYYIRTAEMLKDAGYDVRVENPLSIKRYAERVLTKMI